MQKIICSLVFSLCLPVSALAQKLGQENKPPLGAKIQQAITEANRGAGNCCLPSETPTSQALRHSKKSPEQITQYIKEAYETKRRITVKAWMYAYERQGTECVLVEKVRSVSGVITSFSSGETFTVKEYRGFAPFMSDSEGGGFQIQHTLCFSKVIAVKEQNQFLRMMRDTGETAGFIGFGAAMVPTIPVVLILARAGKIDW